MNEPKIKTLKNTMVLPDMINEAVNAALEKKGQDIVVLNLSTSGAFTDYFVICSGQTGRQVRAIVDGVLKMLREKGNRPSHVEGYDHDGNLNIRGEKHKIQISVGDTTRITISMEQIDIPADVEGNGSDNSGDEATTG